jgi:hypothetical protein
MSVTATNAGVGGLGSFFLHEAIAITAINTATAEDRKIVRCVLFLIID